MKPKDKFKITKARNT